VRGTLSMARSAHPDSADSQFFIVFAPSSFLDGKYTVWGKVAEGMEHVDQIKKGDQSRNGSVEEPDKIVSLTVAADESKKKPAKKKPAKKKAPKKPTKK
jgi:peptidylprolyl isomerase